MPKIVKPSDPTKQSGRMQPPSSIMLGRTKTNYDSIATTAYKIEGDHAKIFAGPSTAGDREKVLKFVVVYIYMVDLYISAHLYFNLSHLSQSYTIISFNPFLLCTYINSTLLT